MQHLLRKLLFLLLFVISIPSSWSEELLDIPIITAPEVHYMMEHQKVLVVNSLTRIEHQIQHIPGSINIPFMEMEATKELPADKMHPMIFYCMGVECVYSKRASEVAVKRGYSKVYWFQGGIPDWRNFGYPMYIDESMAKIKVKRISPEDVLKLIKNKKPFILDVRPKWWPHSSSFIKGAVELPLAELKDRHGEIPNDRKILITDGIMKQSAAAAKFLASRGYEVIGILKGGIIRWENEGLPLEKRHAAQPDIKPK